MERCVKEAYAKINLCLDVTGRLPNGYHQVRMIMQTVGIHDTLSFERTEGEIRITADGGELPLGPDNLIYTEIACTREIEDSVLVRFVAEDQSEGEQKSYSAVRYDPNNHCSRVFLLIAADADPDADPDEDAPTEEEFAAAVRAAETYKAENTALKARIAALEKRPAAPSAHKSFKQADGSATTGDKGLDRLANRFKKSK